MLPEITLLRAAGIVLVVLGHADIFGQQAPYVYPVAEKIIYSFHMPLFIFISGFVFMYTNQHKGSFNFAAFIRKKISRLLVPAFLVLTLAFPLRAMLAYVKGAGVDSYSLANYFKMFFLKEYLPIEFFWFIFVLFDIFLLAKILLHCIRKKYLALLVSLLFMTMNLFPVDIDLFYLKYISAYLIYFWLGCLCCFAASGKRLIHLFPGGNVSLLMATALLFLLLYLNLTGKRTGIWELACALSGICMSYSFVRYLNQFQLAYLRLIGKYTFQIFLFSWFFHRLVETIMFQKLQLMFWVTYPTSVALAIAGPLLLTKLVLEKSPKMKSLFGV